MWNAKGRDSAVSPVIGTILLVAITVVLAAIITAVVMGFSGNPDAKDVGLNVKAAAGNDAVLILYAGASLSDLVKLEMIDQGSSDGEYVNIWNSSGTSHVNVGAPYSAIGVARPSGDMAVYDTTINVKGTFTNGKEVILLVQSMTFTNVTIIESGPFKINKPVSVGANIISGTGTPGFILEVRFPDGATAQAMVDSNGFWSVNVPASTILVAGQTISAIQSEGFPLQPVNTATAIVQSA